ncbi:MAG: hypothetical protein JNL01_07995 [Bdellovibrionales bacterium]|nr:hypothetical protein [Bdellovibrionales bacterium]
MKLFATTLMMATLLWNQVGIPVASAAKANASQKRAERLQKRYDKFSTEKKIRFLDRRIARIDHVEAKLGENNEKAAKTLEKMKVAFLANTAENSENLKLSEAAKNELSGETKDPVEEYTQEELEELDSCGQGLPTQDEVTVAQAKSLDVEVLRAKVSKIRSELVKEKSRVQNGEREPASVDKNRGLFIGLCVLAGAVMTFGLLILFGVIVIPSMGVGVGLMLALIGGLTLFGLTDVGSS